MPLLDDSEHDKCTFKQFCLVPQVENATFSRQNHAILQCSAKDFVAKQKTSINLTVSLKEGCVVSRDASDTKHFYRSSDAQCISIISKTVEGSIKWIFEHWKHEICIFQAEIARPWIDSTFGTACWNESTDEFLFAAEEPLSSNGRLLAEGMGELYSEAVNPKLFLYQASQARIIPIPTSQDSVAVNANWLGQNQICYTQVPTKPWKLGYNFMCNQPYSLAIQQISHPENLLCLSEAFGMKSLRNPISLSNGKVVFLANETGGAHMKPSFLCIWDPTENAVKKILDFPLDCRMIKPNLLIEPYLWIEVRKQALYKEALLVDLFQGKIHSQIPKIDRLFCASSREGLIYSKSTISSFSIIWRKANDNVELASEFEVYSFNSPINPSKTPIKASPDYESLLLHTPKSPNVKGLFLITHGGPHASLTETFSPFLSALCASGWDLALINYPEKEVVGQIGKLDVNFVIEIASHLTPKYQKMAFYGGSHAGFIGAWISVLAPQLFSHVILKNPVVNLVSQYSTRDIPNWALEESGIAFDYSPLTQEQMSKLYENSPISKAIKMEKSPLKTLLCLGAQDKRCPMQQGMEWYRALKASGNFVRCFVYPEDGHALDSFEGYVDCLEQIMKFLSDE